MPLIRVTTTLSEIPEGFEARLAELVKTIFTWMDTPWCYILASPNTKIYNSTRCPTGTEPMVILEIKSMDTFKADNVSAARESFIDFLSNELSVEKSRILVAFEDVPTNFAGMGK